MRIHNLIESQRFESRRSLVKWGQKGSLALDAGATSGSLGCFSSESLVTAMSREGFSHSVRAAHRLRATLQLVPLSLVRRACSPHLLRRRRLIVREAAMHLCR